LQAVSLKIVNDLKKKEILRVGDKMAPHTTAFSAFVAFSALSALLAFWKTFELKGTWQ
jgi:hypothetical protein